MTLTHEMLFNELEKAIAMKLLTGYNDTNSKQHLIKTFETKLSGKNDHVSNFLNKLRSRWRDANRTKDMFMKKNKDWLSIKIDVDIAPEPSPSKTPGRPKIAEFENASDRTKRRRIDDLMSVTPPRLSYAASKLNKKDTKAKNLSTYTPNEALALIFDCSLSKRSYQIIRNGANTRNHNLYPSYNQVREAKQDCLPSPIDSWKVDDFSAEIEMQDLLDHTIHRIIEAGSINLNDIKDMKLVGKLGFDGSTGQSFYKQRATNSEERNLTNEGAIFTTCFVPLQIIGTNVLTKLSQIIWKNNKPSSTMYCRPLRFSFQKETINILKAEESFLKEKILTLMPTKLIDNRLVTHELHITMIDGKVATSLSTETSSYQCCSMCGASPKVMNDIDQMKIRPVSKENLNHGLSTLHAWIRFMECILHIAYKLPIKKWQARTPQEKDKVKDQKMKIQKLFRDKVGLIIDIPQSGGSGTSNDGNTARRFFNNFVETSTITGIDTNLIERFYIILCVLSSGHQIDCDKFKDYSYETANLYVSLYSWYYMPQTLHKVLIHGSDVIKNFTLPIGSLSEEALEAQNKHFRNYRESYTRKFSRIKSNEDLMSRLLCASDPLISSIRRVSIKRVKELPDKAMNLIMSEKEEELDIEMEEQLYLEAS